MSYQLYTDGASRGNPGKACAGIVIKENERLEKERSWEYNVDVIQKNIKMATAGQKLPPYRMGNFSARMKSVPLPSNVAVKWVCDFLQPFMSSVLECLQRLDERIKAIEETIPSPRKNIY